jgi:hypothetical protein
VIADGPLRRRQIRQIDRGFEGGSLVPFVERIDVGEEEPAPGIREGRIELQGQVRAQRIQDPVAAGVEGLRARRGVPAGGLDRRFELGRREALSIG